MIGTSLPLSSIEKINYGGKSKHGHTEYVIHTADEGAFRIGSSEYEKIAGSPLQMIPALPGVEALQVSVDQDGPFVNRAPVIAWARCFDGSIRIVTPAGVDDGHMWKEGQGYVLMPDGSVHAVGEYLDVCRFDTLESYVAYEVDENQKRAEARLLKAKAADGGVA
jgi:hypothetical protein